MWSGEQQAWPTFFAQTTIRRALLGSSAVCLGALCYFRGQFFPRVLEKRNEVVQPPVKKLQLSVFRQPTIRSYTENFYKHYSRDFLYSADTLRDSWQEDVVASETIIPKQVAAVLSPTFHIQQSERHTVQELVVVQTPVVQEIGASQSPDLSLSSRVVSDQGNQKRQVSSQIKGVEPHSAKANPQLLEKMKQLKLISQKANNCFQESQKAIALIQKEKRSFSSREGEFVIKMFTAGLTHTASLADGIYSIVETYPQMSHKNKLKQYNVTCNKWFQAVSNRMQDGTHTHIEVSIQEAMSLLKTFETMVDGSI